MKKERPQITLALFIVVGVLIGGVSILGAAVMEVKAFDSWLYG